MIVPLRLTRPTLLPAMLLLTTLALSGCTGGATDKDSGADTRPRDGGTGPAVASNDTTPVEQAPTGAAPASRSDLTLGDKKPAQNDLLLLYYSDDPDTLNAITSNDTVSTAFQRHVYEPLADRNFADPDEWVPMLAESWTFDEETLTYKIKLREGVYWQPMQLPDGTDLPRTQFTSADVQFTFDCILNENIEAAALRSYYLNTESKSSADKYKITVTTIDEFTIKVKWAEPYFLSTAFTLNVPMMPRHVYSVDERGEPISLDFRNSKDFAEKFNNHWANRTMCGTGPMIFDRWVRDQEAVLKRNDDYWGAPYYFSNIVYRNISNPNTALQQVLQGDVDWGSIPQKDQFMQSKKHANVEAGKVKLVEYAYPGYRYVGYNQQRELFKDKRVRWAISHAVPVDDIIEKIYFGLASPLTGPFLPGSSAADDTIPQVEYNLDKAKALLEEAGWTDSDSDGVRDKFIAGQKIDAVFDMMIFSDSPQFRQIAEIIAENCRKIGVTVKITPTKWALMLQKLRKKEYDASILGWALDWQGDPFQLWHGSQADLPESSNAIGYKNPEVDKLIEELRVTLDEQKQIELYHKIHLLIYEDQPYTFLFMEKATAGYDARIENVEFYKIRPCIDTREWFSTSPRPWKN